MRTETCTVVKAAYYCKSNPNGHLELGGTPRALKSNLNSLDITWAYQTVSPLHRIAENCEQKPFPLAFIHYFPTSLRHGFVSIAMTHRLYQLPEGTPRNFLLEAQSRNYQYRGMALRALKEEIASEKGGATPGLVASTVTLLSVDLSLSTVTDWRHHFNAIVAMMKLLGGLKTVHRTMPFMRLTLVAIIVYETFGNTTSPYCDQLITFTNSGMVDDLSEIYGDGVLPVYLGTLCPRQLLLNVLSINELRQQAANPAAKAGPGQSTAGDLLEQIHDFSPGDWIKGKATATSKREWLLIGSTYQSAVALYCIMSLQSLSILPSALYVTAMDAAHYERLMQLLKQALAFPHLRHCLMWPLIVAGARAVYGSADDRKFVDEQLKELSRVGGTALPLTARAALKRFWASGKTGWDDCFDKPYIFAA
ncbi:hypothetical protein DL767_002420 [Monosporascus sp. MG133]|nr:hypothetical protein DL767_002420 [Monosporascus sp. MG133]